MIIKFHCVGITADECDNELVRLDAVTNKAWAKYTPAGSLALYINNPAAKGKFKILQEYFIEITPVPAERG